jgi:hypothetical protein
LSLGALAVCIRHRADFLPGVGGSTSGHNNFVRPFFKVIKIAVLFYSGGTFIKDTINVASLPFNESSI